jgi:hypothetical protein
VPPSVCISITINDIGWPDTILVPRKEPAPSANDVIAGYRRLVVRAPDHGVRMIGATLTPFEDVFHSTPLRLLQ